MSPAAPSTPTPMPPSDRPGDPGSASPGGDATALQNRMMWRGQAGHYEVWYLTLSHLLSRTGFWIRYTLESPSPSHGQPYVQLWFCRGDAQDPGRNFGINQRFPISTLASLQSPFSIRIGDAQLSHHSMRGELSGDGHHVRWDLQWRPAEKTHLFLPQSLYREPFGIAETLVLSPNLSIAIRGTIEVDGQVYELKDDPGGQTHLWGRKHAYAWAWGHCNAFRDASDPTRPSQAVLETLSVRMRRGPVVVPLTLFALYPDGLAGDCIRFTEWSDLPFCRSDYRTGHYSLLGQGGRYKVEARFSCQADDMLRSEYVDPDGTPAYCHFAAAAHCHLTLWQRPLPTAGWRLERELRSESGAQFEWGGRAGDSLVRRRHVTVGI